MAHQVFQLGTMIAFVAANPPRAPVSVGSAQYTTLDIDGFSVTDAWFPPDTHIPRHSHAGPCLSILLEGQIEFRHGSRVDSCQVGSVQVEPAGEPHSNQIGPSGARLLILEPRPSRLGCGAAAVTSLTATVRRFEDPTLTATARALVTEMRTPDALSPFAAHGIAVGILTRAARTAGLAGERVGPPPWLRRAMALVRERFLEDLDARTLAADVGVHPTHLARVFSAHYREPLGACIRRLRLEWATDQIRSGERSLSDIAIAAGFADQSHFTRHFRRQYGVTPGEYRRG